jgi:L-alanine-DL-glutamate epimerase-like enolase superfamily enzyme
MTDRTSARVRTVGRRPGRLARMTVAVEKEEGREGLGLCRGAHGAFDGEMRDEGVDLGLAHLARMALVVKEDEAADPGDVRLLGPQAVVAGADRHADSVEQARLAGRRVRRRGPRAALRHGPAVYLSRAGRPTIGEGEGPF